MVIKNRNWTDFLSVAAFFKHPRNLEPTVLKEEEALISLNMVWLFFKKKATDKMMLHVSPQMNH